LNWLAQQEKSVTEFFFEYGLFAAKLATFVIAILVVIVEERPYRDHPGQ
jgi:hypothetical protein